MPEKKRVRVSIIIPTFNGRGLLEINLPYIQEIYNKHLVDEVLIIDDGSSDETEKFIKAVYPDFRLVRHKKNRGFSATINTGVRSSRGEFVVLLNNDVHPKADFLAKVYPFIKKDPVMFAVSFHEKGYGWADGDIEDGFIVHKQGTEDRVPHETFFANAGGAIYRRELWIKLGGLDEKLYSPYYWEDVDISYRAHKRGYKIYWHPAGYVSPNLSATVSRQAKSKVHAIQQRNQLLFIWKNLTSQNLFRKHIIGVVKRVIRHPGYIKIVVFALIKLRFVLGKRKKELKETKVSDEAILTKY